MSNVIEVLTAKELAGLLKVSERTILDLARGGKIPHRRVGNRWRFVFSEVLDSLLVLPDEKDNEEAERRRFIAPTEADIDWG